MARKHKSASGASSANGAESVGPEVEVCPETARNVSRITQSDLDEIDPKHQLLLSSYGRLLYAAKYVAPAIEELGGYRKPENQIKLLRWFEEAERAALGPEMLERLIRSNERVEALLSQKEGGAQRVSNAPTPPRKKGAAPN